MADHRPHRRAGGDPVSTPTAYRPVPSLLTSLRRAGWGDLAGRDMQAVRTTLAALADRLPHKSATGRTTVAQVADAAGLSERWTRRCMTVLEDLGLIEWQRGGVQRGLPVPSVVRIIKTALVDLIEAARPIQAARDTARAIATRARIAAARLWWCGPRKRWSGHAALSADPHPKRGVTNGDDSPNPAIKQEGNTEMGTYDRYRGAADETDCPRPGHSGLIGMTRHGVPRCPECRRCPQPAAPKPEPVQLAWALPGGQPAPVVDLAQARVRHGR